LYSGAAWFESSAILNEDEDTNLLECYAVSADKYLPTFGGTTFLRNVGHDRKVNHTVLFWVTIGNPFLLEGPAADATDAPQPSGLLCNPMMKIKRKMISFFIFPSNGTPME
jgi:hypothetical protein